MGCPTEVEIGDNLTFSVITHTPATGAITDADAVPAYRLYEDETDPPILTGNMAKLDDDDTMGFYTETIACTSGNGFENGKTYTVYITAAVGGVTGGVSYSFKAYDYRKSDLRAMGGVAQSATDLKDFADTGYDPATHLISEITAARMGALTDWINGGRLDLLLDAIKAITDQINFTGTYVNAQVKAKDNIDFGVLEKISLNAATPSVTVSDKTGFSLSAAGVQAIWDALTSALTTVGSIGKKLADWVVGTIDTYTGNTKQTGDAYAIATNGTYGNSALQVLIAALNNLSQADIRTAVGLAAANLDTQLSAIAGYIDTEVTAIINAIAALNNLSAAQVNSECDTAISDAALATAANLAAAKVVVDAIKIVTDILAGLYEDVGGYRFTEKALEQAPSGTGGDATAANQNDIIDKLKGLMSKAYTLITAVGTFNPANHSNEAIRERGDSAWLTGGGLSGSNDVTLTIQDDASNNVPECYVEIWDSAGTTFYEKKITNSSGQTVHHLDDGTYIIKIHKGGYSFDDETLVVNGDETETYTGERQTPDAPTSPSSCRVYEYAFMPDGITPMDSVQAVAQIVSLPEDSGTMLHSGQEIEAIYDSDTGLLYWDIIQGAQAEFTISNFGINNLLKTVPSTSTARLSDIT